ncbi:MAG: HNH endonuclease [Clostridia bacterium]|jgi:hypothetical protein
MFENRLKKKLIAPEKKPKLEKMVIGKITMFRMECPFCGEQNLSKTGTFKCTYCDETYSEQTVNKVRVIVGKTKRNRPPALIVRKLLALQNNKCFYCGKEFDLQYYRNGKVRKLIAHADHQIPYSYLLTNPDDNFVMACCVCNMFKSAKMFESVEDCKKYLDYKWDKEVSSGNIEILT